uniref:Cytosine permease n=1 Tax=Streptomyces sp. NBC_00119 TaxID=2975659 RepID=A0AAU1U0D4_9ACTN
MALRATGGTSEGPERGEPVTDRTGHVETHGVDHIPDADRHGRPRSLFTVWAASNMSYLYIVLGGAMVLLGLDIWQSFAVIVAGNLLWAGVGYLAISGPSSGTPSWVVTRTMFGVRGNRFLNVTLGWTIAVAYEAIGLALGSLAGFALVDHLGIHANTPVKVAIVLVTAVVTFSISVYGHATIVRCSIWFTWALTACVLVLAYYVLRHTDWGYRTPAATAVHGPRDSRSWWAAPCHGAAALTTPAICPPTPPARRCAGGRQSADSCRPSCSADSVSWPGRRWT